MTPRFDLFTLVHKGQRRVLFEITSAAGQLSAHDGAGRQGLADQIRAFFATMIEHAEHEDTYLLPLVVQAAPELAARRGQRPLTLHGQKIAKVVPVHAATLACQAGGRKSDAKVPRHPRRRALPGSRHHGAFHCNVARPLAMAASIATPSGAVIPTTGIAIGGVPAMLADSVATPALL